MKLAVIGTGALGSALLEKLAAQGFQNVVLIDPDKLQERNLALSAFLHRAAVAFFSDHAPTEPVPFKAALLAHEARRTYNLHWQVHACDIADVGWQHLEAVDLFCCCTDNTLSRVETAFIARMLRKPVLDGAVFGQGIAAGRVSLFPVRPEGACYLCGMGEDRRAAVLGYAASAAMGCRPPDDPRAMTGTVATLQRTAQLMMQHIERLQNAYDVPSHVTKTSFIGVEAAGLAGTWHDETIALTQSPGCPWHGPIPGSLVPLPWDAAIRNSLRAGADVRELHLAWPICTGAMCTGCGWQGTPLRRVAVVRRSLTCSRCGLADLEPMRALHRVRATDPESALSPQQLGLPSRHLYWLHSSAV